MSKLFVGIALVTLSACSTLIPNLPVARTTAPTATATAPATTTLDAALRPEFRGDLSLVHSPTVYRMNLNLAPSLTQLTGQEAVTYTNRENAPLNEIYFRLFANYPEGGGKIAVSDVRLNGTAVQPTLEVQDTALRIPLGAPLAVGAQANVALNFSVSVPVKAQGHYADLTYAEGISTMPSVYPLIPAYDERGWHIELPPRYGDLVYADSSVYDVNVTAPTTTTVIASGAAVEKTAAGDKTTWHYIGAPMRDFDIDASAVVHQVSAQVGDVTINSYYLPRDGDSGKQVLKFATDALGVYEKRIGPYPFGELDVVETPTTAGGIEYPGVIAISDRLYGDDTQRNFLEVATAHEVAHQWWYSVVGDDQVNTPWMDESLVEYTTVIYMQDIHGAQAAANFQTARHQRLYDQAKHDNEDKPIGLPVMSYGEKQYGEIVYGKGPLFFAAVRKQIGDDNFYKFLQTYYQRYRYQVAMPDDLLKTIQDVSGQDVTPFYDQWVVGK